MQRAQMRHVVGTVRCLLVVTVLALSLAGLPSRTEAAIITTCVKVRGGALRVVAPGTVCRRNEYPMMYNSAGVVGTGDVFAFICPPDSVRSGRICIDTYEASVWETTDAPTIAKIKDGTVTLADLTAGGAIQRGAASDDYGAGCPDTGNGCKNFYAVSIPGVTPSANLTWFQAGAAARNSGKRLPTNQEWQFAALGTPDGAPCIVSAVSAGLTGTAGCVSDVGAFDMVGNLWEWVADWVPLSTACVTDLFGTGDANCLAGASTLSGPGALIRGVHFDNGTNAGVFAVSGNYTPSSAFSFLGFRAAR